MARDRRIDWQPVQTLAGADPTVPLVHNGDERPQDRGALVLFGDEARWRLAEMITHYRTPRSRKLMDSLWARAGVVLLGLDFLWQVLTSSGVLPR